MPKGEPFPGYAPLRQKLLTATDKGTSPCIRGRATCCKQTTIGTTEGDRRLILKAVASGAIRERVRDQAIEKAANPATTSCPFLQDNGDCGIYAQRPLVCIAWGKAVPKPESMQFIGELKRRSSKKDPGVPFDRLQALTCPDCAQQVNETKPIYPHSVVTAVGDAMMYIAREDFAGTKEQTIVDFINETRLKN